ncbi:MAG: hypothetical protein Q9183_004438, partial [Haloplaca sp. 2 TL-2023]
MNAGTSASVPATGRTVATVSEDWTIYRDTIERLYVTEDRSLPEVVALMKANGFSATERQYKRRITEWNLDKNIKDDEMRAIITLRRFRRDQGKDSVFYVRGRLVDPRKIDRFASRKKINRDNALEPLIQLLLPDVTNVRCFTPSHGHLPGGRAKAEAPSGKSTYNTSRNDLSPGEESALARAKEKRVDNPDPTLQTQNVEMIDGFGFPLISGCEGRMLPYTKPVSLELNQYEVYSGSQSQNDHKEAFPSRTLSSHHNPNRDGRPLKRKDPDLNRTTATKQHCGPTRKGMARTAPADLPWSSLKLPEDAGPTEASKTLLEIKYGNTASHRDPAPKTRTRSTDQQQRPPVPATMDASSLATEPQLKGLLVDHGLPDDDEPGGGRFQIIEHASSDVSVTSGRRAHYYALPIVVEPSSLPYSLWQRPCELFYFHFFVDNTARLLSAYDCNSNDFRIILPRLALQNENLLSLLLTYSARHRACLLDHQQPARRVCIWFNNALRSLKHSLSGPRHSIHDLAMLIMMASMDIVCHTASSDMVPWRSTLKTAKSVYDAYFEPLSKASHFSPNEQQEIHFLNRWLTYLLIMGRLSKPCNVMIDGSFGEIMPTSRSSERSSEPPVHGSHVAILERTISDTFQDELYGPSLSTLVPIPPLQTTNVHEARGYSSTKGDSRDPSPYSNSSEQKPRSFSPCSLSNSPSESNTGAASWILQLEDALSARAITDYHPRCGSSCPSKTVSPKEALLEHNHTEGDAGPPLFDDETQSMAVDCLYGCSADLMSLMSIIAALIERPDKALKPEVEKLKTNLWRMVHRKTGSICRNTGSRGQDGRDGMPKEVEVNITQKLMIWAMMIILYLRVERRLFSDHGVQTLLQGALEALDELALNGRIQCGDLFPLFVTGCEIRNPNNRDRICKWYKALEKLGMTQ